MRRIADARGLVLLVGADAQLAEAVGAEGLHMPERLAGAIPDLRLTRPNWLMTVAAHDREALAAGERLGADALVVSPIFPSNSPSAVKPIGVEGLKDLVAMTTAPLYALGGVNGRTVSCLTDTGIAGIAAVEALSEPRT